MFGASDLKQSARSHADTQAREFQFEQGLVADTRYVVAAAMTRVCLSLSLNSKHLAQACGLPHIERLRDQKYLGETAVENRRSTPGDSRCESA